ncbi:hypothetical protein MetexDRAFT_0225 [Methylorubrum extorquens DSM 13060]|uniref:Uncharacterized protein n=1 Tax=Methylorubrum extorquens DSM 13060 TaxID=882800 RepID=H1KC63_METEX|nr:hypothetical protein MetexDRAFT_0225 [Methylorubrum extorquens DSM 13060]
MVRKTILTVALGLAVLLSGEAGASQTGDAIIGYVKQHEPRFSCSEHPVGERRFVHCRSSASCGVPNLLFEIRGGLAVWGNGKTQTFVETHKRYPTPIVDGRPLPYTPSEIFKAVGCPNA